MATNSAKKSLHAAASRRFHLSKWYADCVSDSGDTVVVYHGLARWRGIALRYSSLLTLIRNAPPRIKYSIASSTAPSFDGEILSWKSRTLRFEGTWKSIDPPHSETVFSSHQGTVEWNCLQPRARAEIHWGKNEVLSGLGYAERVEMSIASWEIPIQQLLWGRFLSPADSLVWMDWRGSVAHRVLLHNGIALTEGEVAEKQIRFGANGILALGSGTILRQGTLGSAALAAIPGVKTILPRQILGVRETKWRSRSQFRHGTRTSEGWSIHEVVQWPL